MRFLHTSDWHLGCSLCERKRYDEQEAFLDWLLEEIRRRKVDALLVAGDVFDTTAPSHRAQELYYGFLDRLAAAGCRHAVVVGGNHDSPTFLEAPKALLRRFRVHVTGEKPEDEAEEVVVLREADGTASAVVCAVPYLHDRFLRIVAPGETQDDRSRKIADGLKEHYARVAGLARYARNHEGNPELPLIATGHLFAAGGATVEGDGVRDLYVGTLAQVDASAFPEALDYVALGHLHAAQRVGGTERVRYSGAPIPMGYGEAGSAKKVVVVDVGRDAGSGPQGGRLAVEEVEVPCFQALERISGGMDRILSRIGELALAGSDAWIEVVYTGDAFVADLREQVDAAVAGTRLECRRVQNRRAVEAVLAASDDEETLGDLDVEDVFRRCLETNAVPEEDRGELLRSYEEVLLGMRTRDAQAE